MEIFLGSHHFLLIMKHTPPPLVLPASAVLSIHKTEKFQTALQRYIYNIYIYILVVGID